MGAAQVFFKREMRGWNEIREMEAGGDTKQGTASKLQQSQHGLEGTNNRTMKNLYMAFKCHGSGKRGRNLDNNHEDPEENVGTIMIKR